MMGWLRIRPSPSPTSSLNGRAASLPRPPRLKRESSSFAESLTSFDFRRKTYSEGETDGIDLVSLEAISPCRVSSSNSPSELPRSEEVVVDHVTPPSSPPMSLHDVAPSPSKIKNAVAFFERKASGCPAIPLPIASVAASAASTPMSLTPAYTNAAWHEPDLGRRVSQAESFKSDSEDSMASLVSMLNEPHANICSALEDQPCSIPIHHEPSCPSNIDVVSPIWPYPSPSIRSSINKSESSSLRTLDTNRNAKQDEPDVVQPVTKTSLHSRFTRSVHSRSRTVSEKDLSEAHSSGRQGRFHRPFILSRRTQSRTSTEVDHNSVAALPCFMTSSDDFANHRAVQGLNMVTSGPSMAAFSDGSYSTSQSFSAAGKGVNTSAITPVSAVEDSSNMAHSPQPFQPQSPRPISARSGLPLSSRSVAKAPPTSAVSFFTRPPGMHISDMSLRSLVRLDDNAVILPPRQASPRVPSPSYVDAMSFSWDVPRTGSPASTSSSRRHSVHRVPVKIDSAAHFPRSVSPSWDVRPQSFSAIVEGVPLAPMPTEPTFCSSHSSECSDSAWPPHPIEPSFGRKRSNSKFEPNADLQPIMEGPQTPKSEMQDGSPNPFHVDGHKSAGAVYDPPICSPHEETPAEEAQKKPAKAKRKAKKLKKKKPHERTHKIVRYSRRFILRKKILNFLLGRQLGGAVAEGLKAITCMPVGTDSLDLAVVAVPGGVSSPLHSGAVFPLAVVCGRDVLEDEQKSGKLRIVETRNCVALTAPDAMDAPDKHRRKSRHLSMDDLSSAIRHVDYRSGPKGHVRIE